MDIDIECVVITVKISEGDIEPAIAAARSTGELFVAMAAGPYMLVLRFEGTGQYLRF